MMALKLNKKKYFHFKEESSTTRVKGIREKQFFNDELSSDMSLVSGEFISPKTYFSIQYES
jgi:hypothetical protein